MTFLRAGVSIALLMLGAAAAASGCGGKVLGGTGTGGSAGTGGHPGTGGGPGTGGYVGHPGTGGVSGSTSGTCTSKPSACITPPPASSVPPATTGTETVIAVSRFYLGDRNQQGQPDPTAWKSIGYNLDGLVSKPTDTNHCLPQPGANPVDVKTDGDGGIDNSFGENLLPLLTSLFSDVSVSLNQAISNGTYTELFRLDNLTTAPDQNGVTAALYHGAAKGSPALFNGTDVWPVTYESVTSYNLDAPRIKFPQSYVTNSVWVSGSQAQVTLRLRIQGYALVLPITKTIFTMQLKGTGTQAAAYHGVIAGVMYTEAFVLALQKVAGSFDQSLCNGATFDSIAQQVKAASDIMSDGSNGDPTKTCDAISIGIGFDGVGAKLGPVAPPVTPPPNPCAP